MSRGKRLERYLLAKHNISKLITSKSSPGCPQPDYCMPSSVPSRTTGEDCMAHCPATCGQDEMMCPGGTDIDGMQRNCTSFNSDHILSFSSSGCPLPETCMQNMDGDCPAHCPPPCEWATEMVCPGGSDWNGRFRYF